MVRQTWKVPGTLLLTSLLLSGCGSSDTRPPEDRTGEPIARDAAPPAVTPPGSLEHPVAGPDQERTADAQGLETPKEPPAAGLRTTPSPGALPRTDPKPPLPVEGIEATPPESEGNVPPPGAENIASGAESGVDPPTREAAQEILPEARPVFPDPLPTETPDELILPAGSRITMELETPLSTRTHVPGDVFFSRVLDDVLAPDGMVLLFHGTRVRGEVVASRESDGDRGPELAIEVQQLLLPGKDLRIEAEIVEASVETRASSSGGESAAKVATGAAAGAILGRILGKGGKDAVKGAIAGAIAGGAVAYATREGHAFLPEGSRIVVRLLEPANIPELIRR